MKASAFHLQFFRLEETLKPNFRSDTRQVCFLVRFHLDVVDFGSVSSGTLNACFGYFR